MLNGDYNDSIALFLIRTVTGILFFFQGYDKIFNIKIKNVVATFNDPLNKFRIPLAILKPLITISSVIELLCGLLLIIGLFRNPALMFLALNMIFVAFSFSFIKPMWDMKFYFPRMIFLIILLFCLPGNDIFSLDWILKIGQFYP